MIRKNQTRKMKEADGGGWITVPASIYHGFMGFKAFSKICEFHLLEELSFLAGVI